MVLTLNAGCQQYNWQTDFTAAEQQAREQNKFMFVFYKLWTDADSNRMLGEEVLSAPEVVSLFQDTVNVLIDKDYGPRYVAYVERYGVRTVPSSIFIAPNGRYAVLRGFVPRAQFIQFARSVLNSNGEGLLPPPAARPVP